MRLNGGLQVGVGVGIGKAAGLGRKRAQNNRVGAYGHSFVTQTYNTGLTHNAGIMDAFRQKSYGAIDYCTTTIRGHSGQTSTQLASTAQMDTDITALAAKSVGLVVLILGANDAGAGISAATTLANTQFIINYIQTGLKAALGWDVPVLLVDGSPGSVNQAAFLAAAQVVRPLHNPARGIYVAPVYNALVDTFDSLTPSAGIFQTDNAHPSVIGASRAGTAMWPAIRQAMPAVDLLSASGLLFGGDFAGTGGTLSTTPVAATGVAPTDWIVQASTLAAGTVVCSLGIGTGGYNWWQIAATNISNGAASVTLALSSSANRIALVTPGTDYVELSMLYELDAGSSGLGRLHALAKRQSGGAYTFTATANQASDANWQGSATTMILPPEATSGMLRVPHVLIDAAGTTLGFKIEISTPNNVPSTFTLRLAMPQFRKYTGLLLD